MGGRVLVSRQARRSAPVGDGGTPGGAARAALRSSPSRRIAPRPRARWEGGTHVLCGATRMLAPRRNLESPATLTLAVPRRFVAARRCSDDEVPIVTVFRTRRSSRCRPTNFSGSVPCLDAPGAMRRYVATVFDCERPRSDDGASDGRRRRRSIPRPTSRCRARRCTRGDGIGHADALHPGRRLFAGHPGKPLLGRRSTATIATTSSRSRRDYAASLRSGHLASASPRAGRRAARREARHELRGLVRVVGLCEPLVDGVARP